MRIRLATVLVAGLGLLLAAGSVQAQNPAEPCTENCIEVTVVSPDGTFNNGDPVTVPIRFKQGPDALNNQAAIALTMEIPSLRLANCDNPTPDGLTSAFLIPGEISDLFRVVIENTTCSSENKPCLCPGDGQTRANYINIVLFGPKVLPAPGSGTVDFPLLPADGELLSINLIVDNPTVDPIPLHLFADTDNQATRPKPQFGALLSVGDEEAVDDTLNRTTNVSNVKTTDGAIDVGVIGPQCCGDLNGNGVVSAAEATAAVLAFAREQLELNPAADCNPVNQVVSAAEATRSVLNFAREECLK
jgi:hypothetical protein